MGKRKRSSDEDYDYIARKIKKLERKLKSGRRRRQRDSDTSETSRDTHVSPICTEDGMLEELLPSTVDDVGIKDPSTSTVVAQSGPTTNTSEPLEKCQAEPTQEPAVPELDSEMLAILGDDPSVTTVYGKDIQPQLAVRLQHIATMGLSKESRKELQEKYLPPGNCTLIEAPQLNPEIKAAVSEAIIKRDKGKEVKQKQLCCATTSTAEALTILLTEENNKNKEVIQLLMDASRLLCDCQFTDSSLRRNFVLFNLKKEMKEQIQLAKIDKFLFGTDLADTLKAAKSISKSGAELKPTPATKAPANKTKPAPTHVTQQRNNLNWKAPPPNRRPKGTQRKEPAYRSSHASSSRPLQRAPAQNRVRR